MGDDICRPFTFNRIWLRSSLFSDLPIAETLTWSAWRILCKRAIRPGESLSRLSRLRTDKTPTIISYTIPRRTVYRCPFPHLRVLDCHEPDVAQGTRYSHWRLQATGGRELSTKTNEEPNLIQTDPYNLVWGPSPGPLCSL